MNKPSSKIKAIIFDIGGVLLDADALMEDIVKVFNPEDKQKFWQELNEKFSSLCAGKGTLIEFWKKFAEEHNKQIPEELLKELYIKEFDKKMIINFELIELIKKLKKNYKVAILSNTIKEHSDEFDKTKIPELFDLVVYSWKVKMSKEDKDIFLYTLKKLNLKPEECIFTDDTKKFIEIAKSVGINVILFKDNKSFKDELVKMKIIF